jgi:two-component system cell cycle response regulator CpdR
LAEDDESLRKFLAQALVKAGHDVTDFGDGGDAFECLKGSASTFWSPTS